MDPYTFTAPTPTARTAFSQVLPFDKVFAADLINQMALDQLRPDIDRQQADTMGQVDRSLALSGAYRSGRAPQARNRVNDTYSRLLKEQQADFTGRVKDWTTDWYNRQAEAYYKNPGGYSMPTLPTFDAYMKEKGITPVVPGMKSGLPAQQPGNQFGMLPNPMAPGVPGAPPMPSNSGQGLRPSIQDLPMNPSTLKGRFPAMNGNRQFINMLPGEQLRTPQYGGINKSQLPGLRRNYFNSFLAGAYQR